MKGSVVSDKQIKQKQLSMLQTLCHCNLRLYLELCSGQFSCQYKHKLVNSYCKAGIK